MIQTKATILCALCGIKFIPSAGSICPACTYKSIEEVKMLEGDDILFCRYCERYERPPWINCERQSQQLMGILLKKIKGLNKICFKNASFLWTEPHSKRMKLKVVFEKEMNENMKLQLTEIVEFIQKYSQCPDCRKKFTPHDWNSVVQVRQHVNHKKTFLNMEQVLLKEKAGEKILKTSDEQNGVNFYFSSENDAQRLVDFFKGHLPISLKTSKQLISHNEQNNVSNVKNTFSITIPKICKDDLVRIPRKLSKQLGSCCEVLLCTKVSSYLHFLDLRTFKKIQISGTQYFIYESQIEIYSLKHHGKTFNVLDCEKESKSHLQGSYQKYGLTVMKEDEYKELFTVCHFEQEPGRDLIGFDLVLMDYFDDVKNLPDYVMVKKVKNLEDKKKKRSEKRKKENEKKKQERQREKKEKESESKEDAEEDLEEESDEGEWFAEEDEEEIKKQQ